MNLLFYNQEMTHAAMDKILSKAHHLLDEKKVSIVIQKRVYAVLEECMRNVLHHHVPYPDKKHIPYVSLNNTENKYCIETGNIIQVNEVGKIHELINFINRLTKDELKAVFKNQVMDAEISEKGGAGLGLLTMARMSDSKISVTFEPIDDEFSFIVIKIIIS